MRFRLKRSLAACDSPSLCSPRSATAAGRHVQVTLQRFDSAAVSSTRQGCREVGAVNVSHLQGQVALGRRVHEVLKRKQRINKRKERGGAASSARSPVSRTALSGSCWPTARGGTGRVRWASQAAPRAGRRAAMPIVSPNERS